MTITVFAPASIGNLSVGFDLLGAALTPIDGGFLGDRVSVESNTNSSIKLKVTGVWASKLPQEYERNIVYQCAEFFLQKISSSKGLKITLEKNLPVGSGLGSSASSVVATLVALNEFYGVVFSSNELLRIMGEFEGKVSGSIHYDNVAPCFLGGIQLMIENDDIISQKIPNFEQWYWVVAYPGISLSTSTMRELIPNEFSKKTTIDFARNLSAFVHASYTQDAKLAASLLKDVLAEPYRADHIPNYKKAKLALEQQGMLATGISGSGPTLFTLTDDLNKAQKAKLWLEKNYLQSEMGFSHICQIDPLGARKVN